uniref:NB-ARC domain-containing protein n=1 Tax=Leersia perrieri TaxID=77586 RepID=A0A0D9XJC2_9ORYZ
MEMILDALASSLGEQLVKMVNDEASMLLGASKEVEKLSETLSSLKMFLADAERRHITDVTKEDEYVHEWVRKLKDAIYDGTDIVDDVHLKVEKRRTSMGSCSSSESLFWCLQDPLFTHRIGSRVKELNQRMDGLFSKQAELLKFSITSGNSHSGSNPRRTAPGIIHEDVVGDKIEQDKQKLVDILINRDNDDEDDVGVLVVAILGVGGIGKTTLAKEIFNDQAIHDTFDSKIWLSHPRLQVPVTKACAPGTRVLVTTRNEDVALAMKAAHSHHVAKLELPDSWTLLQKQVALNISEIEIVQECGMKIAEKCDGLPLAIKVIGGVLCKKNTTKNTWEEVLRNQIWSKTGLPGELNKAIYLSYEDLNPNLKQCFAYYSLFPKDEIIGIEEIVSMWIAEGFIGKDGLSTESGINSTMSVGLDYYKDLIKRNLLEPQDDYYNQEHCIMHDVVRSFAQYVASDEALVLRDTQNNAILSSSKFRRLSIAGKQIDWSYLRNQHCLRTLLLFGNMKLKPSDSLRILPCLRTIHIRNFKISILQDSLCKLKHLRYLELSIDETKIRAIPRGFSRLVNLDLLWGFPVHTVVKAAKHYCTLEDVGPLSQLRKLKLKGLENVPSRSMAVLAKLETKSRLTCLELWGTSDETKGAIVAVEQEQIKVVFDQFCPPKCLEELTIGGYYGDVLPDWIKMPDAAIFQDLRRLNLQKLACCIQLPDGLGQLPNLDFLVVNHAPCIKKIGHHLFFEQGQRNMDIKRSSRHDAFPKLHV